jgi:hypothetical protein
MADIISLILTVPVLFWLFLLIAVIFIVFMRWMEQKNRARILDTISQVSPPSPEAGMPGTGSSFTDPPLFNHDVYISYAQQDKPVADAMCATLESHTIRCWIAPRDLLQRMDSLTQMMKAIDTCQVLVVIFSSHANNSLHVSKECTRAIDSGRIIIPFRIEDTLPSDAMKYLIGTPHWLDALTPPLEQHLLRLCDNIRVYLDQKKRLKGTC